MLFLCASIQRASAGGGLRRLGHPEPFLDRILLRDITVLKITLQSGFQTLQKWSALTADYTVARQQGRQMEGALRAAFDETRIEPSSLSHHPGQFQPGDRSAVGEMQNALFIVVGFVKTRIELFLS